MELRDYIPNRNILVAVDVQNDFIDGSLAVTGGEQVVEPINRVAKAVRANMGRVAFTRDWHPATTPHFDAWPVHCVARTNGAKFHQDLDVQRGDIVLNKGMGQTDGYSGMEGVARDGTTLETMIDPNGRWEEVRVFIGGLATDYCVKATAIGAAARFKNRKNVSVYALRDAMRAVNLHENDCEVAIAQMVKAGVQVITVEQALAMIEELGATR